MLIGLSPLYGYTEAAVGERVVHWNQKENTVKWKYSQEDLSDPAGMWAINYKRTFDLFENNMETIQTFKYKNTYPEALSFQIEITLKRVHSAHVQNIDQIRKIEGDSARRVETGKIEGYFSLEVLWICSFCDFISWLVGRNWWASYGRGWMFLLGVIWKIGIKLATIYY